MILLTDEQIVLLFERLKWEPVYEDREIVVARKRGIGYSTDPRIAAIEVALSIGREAMVRLQTLKEAKR